MVLVDTTVWIDFFAAREAPHVIKLEELIDNNDDICICGIIWAETLQGICADIEFQRTKEYFDSLIFLTMAKRTFTCAADLYRSLRKKGITIRKPLDCMIAAVAIENDVIILHHDRDFENIARYSKLKIFSNNLLGKKDET